MDKNIHDSIREKEAEVFVTIDRADTEGPIMKPFAVGNFWFDRVEEYYGGGFTAETFIEQFPEGASAKWRDWQVKNGFINPENDFIYMPEAAWIVRTPKLNILIDPTWGNDKDRGGNFGDHLNVPWLERFANSGLTPEDIDIVINTHLHADHCGWNTKLVDGKWVPTFPNARHLIPRKEYDFWNGLYNNPAKRDPIHCAGFEDSVLPIFEAGLGELIDDNYEVAEGITMEYISGHTPGQMMIKFESRGEFAIFCSDGIHVPIQVMYPDCNDFLAEIPDEARKSRHKFLSECAEKKGLLITPHFPAPYCGWIGKDEKGGYTFEPAWWRK